MVSTAVLVEGVSDVIAVETLPRRREVDLAAAGIDIVSLGGVTNAARMLRELKPTGVRLAGLCDATEIRYVRHALELVGMGENLNRQDLETLGFFACDPDLEGELIRALGADRVEAIFDEEGDLKSFRTFQNQPAQRERDTTGQLHRFLGTMGGRKAHYARALVEGLDSGAIPRPLDELLEFVLA